MTGWYKATASTPEPTRMRLYAFDASGTNIGMATADNVADTPHPPTTTATNQTRSNLIGALLRRYGDQFDRYEEWHSR